MSANILNDTIDVAKPMLKKERKSISKSRMILIVT